MTVANTFTDFAEKGIIFFRELHHDWKVTALRSSIDRLLYQMVLPYLSIYTLALGATHTQLGLVNFIGMAVAGFISPFNGWLIDRIGTKAIYLIGIALLALSFLTYGVAQSWPIIILALMAYWIGFTVSMHGCAVICGNSLNRHQRATAMSCCETLAMGLMGMLGPMLGAFAVTTFGGINTSGIRPLFFIALAGTVGTFFLVKTQISNHRWGDSDNSKPNFFVDLRHVFRQGRNLKRWLVVSSITYLPMGMVIPFTQVFAREAKGADEFVLGAMVTGFALTPLLLGIPLGRLSDNIGRKKVLYLVAPFFWASNLFLIWAPNSFFLIVSGVLLGFLSVNLVITGAMTFEMVPPEQMGRWMGITRFCRMLLAAAAAYWAGTLMDTIGQKYVFLFVIALDILIRIPLLMSTPETLGPRTRAEEPVV
jgi:MFS family permease